ncbi:hypothetical protein GII40_00156 [Candidatus Profftia lariciata]|nr:hypothetical protein GII40_00156 [Candidatus Profftia lariciata]
MGNIIKESTVFVGDKVKTGSLMMILENNDLDKNSLTNITVPDIGDDELEVTEIIVTVGDTVEKEQSLITVEGNKVSMEIPSPFAGVIKDIKVSVGHTVRTGSLIMLIKRTNCLSIQDTVTSITSVEKLDMKNTSTLHSGNNIKDNNIIAKINNTIDVEQKYTILENNKKNNSSFAINLEKDSKIPNFDKKDQYKHNIVPVVSIDNTLNKTANEKKLYVHATPIIRRIAREFGVNLANITGSGRKGRILREDIQSYIRNIIKISESNSVLMNNNALSNVLPKSNINFKKFGDTEEVALSRIQKISGDTLSRNWVTIPHVTQFEEADITDIEEFRKQQNSEAEKKKQNIKMTPVVFVMKATAKALEKFPRINSYLSEDGYKLILRKYINIGVAVDTPNGLVVPVIREVNKKGLITLSSELDTIVNKARNGMLTISDVQGGCFTISSLGGIGGIAFTPIVNAPEIAILGLSKSSIKPIWNGIKFAPRLMLPLSLSFDHRVIDGVAGASFVAYIAAIISDLRLLII